MNCPDELRFPRVLVGEHVVSENPPKRPKHCPSKMIDEVSHVWEGQGVNRFLWPATDDRYAWILRGCGDNGCETCGFLKWHQSGKINVFKSSTCHAVNVIDDLPEKCWCHEPWKEGQHSTGTEVWCATKEPPTFGAGDWWVTS